MAISISASYTLAPQEAQPIQPNSHQQRC